ncbi:MAG TPA: hypothetical protein VNS46_04800, partial [Nocardioides sp.]|nr:hypothetical protein [Nocardioides sp.]
MRRLIVLGALLVTSALAALPAGADPLNPTNPLQDARPWQYSTVTTRANPELLNYRAETDPARKALLGRIALTPRVRWFANCGACNVDRVRQSVSSYVADARRADPDAVAQ